MSDGASQHPYGSREGIALWQADAGRILAEVEAFGDGTRNILDPQMVLDKAFPEYGEPEPPQPEARHVNYGQKPKQSALERIVMPESLRNAVYKLGSLALDTVNNVVTSIINNH